MRIRANGIDLELEDTGGAGVAVLLIMGLGMQLTAWPQPLVDALTARGYRVIRFDNRDSGLSTHLDAHPQPNRAWSYLRYRLGLALHAPYTLADMAQDALGLLDALGVGQAHVVGASMGGMIAQRVAIARPDRVLSLTSIMSSSSARGLPGPRSAVIRALWARPHSLARDAVVEYFVRFFQTIGSTTLADPEEVLRAEVVAALARGGYHPQATQRQLLAVAADTARAKALRKVHCPTLVIHGRDDPFLPLACGADTAQRIPGAQLQAIAGMGHDLAGGVIAEILPLLLGHLDRNTCHDH